VAAAGGALLGFEKDGSKSRAWGEGAPREGGMGTLGRTQAVNISTKHVSLTLRGGKFDAMLA